MMKRGWMDEGWGLKGETEGKRARYHRSASLVLGNFIVRAEGQGYQKPLQKRVESQCKLSSPNSSEIELQSSKVKWRDHKQNQAD